ncbi:MAG: KpsF/GutQ family sugar-phosphate isomerase [Gammaproteobacteria bacterium]|nr:KpsF/GutQ family sugar-phosphate isomerase [Gammaproteobacteria bacterium]
MNQKKLQQLGLAVIKTERAALQELESRIDQQFVHACELILECQGRVVVTGMGKSGHIGGKIAATLASTGSPAFFVHPGEASHGDLGMITAQDVVLALSNSGETQELLTIIPIIKRLGIPLITLTGNPSSTMAKAANANLNVSVSHEACPLGLAPTASTTATLVMGDALAVALLESRNFTAEDFARSHPGGTLGRRLLLHVGDIMHTGDGIPRVLHNASLSEALMEMTQKGLGMTAIVDAQGTMLGIYTDGDLRRTLDAEINLHQTTIAEVMNSKCKTIAADMLAAEALQRMDQYKINALLVTDEQQRLVGALNMHDLLRAGVV